MPGGSSDFPRGWAVSSGAVASGAPVSITIAGVPGVVHVLDAFSSRIFAGGAAGAGALLNVTVTTGAVTTVLGVLVGGTATFAADDQAGTGLDFATAPGDALVVAWSANVPANYGGFLTVQGHDV